MIDANFFWHGPTLSLYESACLGSFVLQGAKVTLHTFNLDLQVPQGVRLRDASNLASIDEVHAYTQEGHKGSVAAFSDIIRYRILADQPGWWFDTDVFCLQPASRFLELQKTCPGLLVGYESPKTTNGAVMCINDPSVARALSAMAEAKGKVFRWGVIGPKLIAEYAGIHPQRVRIVDQSHFYPVPLDSAGDMFLPESADACGMACRDSLSIHLWNEYLRRMHVPKSLKPPVGSYLARLFSTVEVRVDPDASMTTDTYRGLRLAGGLTRLDFMALKASGRIKRLLARVRRR